VHTDQSHVHTFFGHVLPLTAIITGLEASGPKVNPGIHSGGCTPAGNAMDFGVSATGYHSLLSRSNTLSWITSGNSRISVGSSAPPGGG
jgi:hypothetical protein